MRKITSDFVIIGAGIIGLSLAMNLRNTFPNKRICIIDKEADSGYHSSGRNSGVLHAGFYYYPDSLKAKFTRQGNYELTKYCEEKGLKINKCGKVVVAKTEEELETLYELKRRGDANGVEVYIIDEKELEEIEPNAKTFKHALWSPKTSVVDPSEILESLKRDLKEQNVSFYYNTPYLRKLEKNAISAGEYIFEFEKVINAAGLYADKIAKDFGFSEEYTILPFKGIYIEYTGEDKFIRTNIYPVPNIKNPFLGVHFTIKVDGKIKIGPTAMPCFWRENYSGLRNFNLEEFIRILIWDTKMIFSSQIFRKTAFDEIKKYIKSNMISEAAKLVKKVNVNGFKNWGKPGIRAQLLNTKKMELVHDFIVEADDTSIHILNAVSPAFTASFPFTREVVKRYILGGNDGKNQEN